MRRPAAASRDCGCSTELSGYKRGQVGHVSSGRLVSPGLRPTGRRTANSSEETPMTATSATIGRKGGERGGDGGRPDLFDGEAGHPIREVCDHVQAAGHDPLKARLYRLRLTMLMVADAHGGRHPELGRALTVFA